jgi:hypothetical protein
VQVSGVSAPAGRRATGRAARLAAEREQQQRAARQRRVTLAVTSVVAVLVVIAGLVVLAVTRDSPTTTPTGTAAPSMVQAVTGVPEATLARVGGGSSKAEGLAALDGRALTKDGKPRVVYIGAEYCPFCAAERWPVTIALSRFGTWSGLGQTYSSASDVDPSTPTLSFHGATYTSQYLSFEGVETTTNQRSGNGYAPLDRLTPEQEQLLRTYDAPPYQQSTGSIPFLDIAGSYTIAGAGYDPGLLAGKTPEQVAGLLAPGTGPEATAILGAANRLTAALCAVTEQQPAAVCSAEPVTSLAGQLPRVG